jgi:hypothetical protein
MVHQRYPDIWFGLWTRKGHAMNWMYDDYYKLWLVDGQNFINASIMGSDSLAYYEPYQISLHGAV